MKKLFGMLLISLSIFAHCQNATFQVGGQVPYEVSETDNEGD
jgi:hypothetical protein